MPQVWSLVVPEVSTNSAFDPVFGSGSASANWGTVNGSLTIDTTVGNVLFGPYCGYYSGASLPADSGAYCNTKSMANATTQVSVWVKGTTPTKVGVYVGAAWTLKTATLLETLPSGHSRYGASFTGAEAATATRAGAFFSGTTAAYIAGIQIEQSSTYTTQVWGDAGPGYAWNGPSNAATSTRYLLTTDGATVVGGAVQYIDNGTNVVCSGAAGPGLLPYEIVSQAVVGAPGNIYIDTTLKPREIVLTLAVVGTSLANVHATRLTLLQKMGVGREVTLRYHGANAVLECRAAVMESFDLPGGRGWNGQTKLSFMALDPRFSLIYQELTSLTLSSSPSSSNGRQRNRLTGWAAMSSGLNAAGRRLIQGPDGTVYCGTVSNAGTAKLQKWSGTTQAWVDVASFTGSITAGPVIYDLVPSLDWTKLYVLGDYTTVGGTAGHGGVAEITLSSGAAAKLGTGAAGGAVYCGAMRSDGRLYVGGAMATNMGGVANTSYFAYWNGSTWVSVGSTRPTAAVWCMIVDAYDNLYLGGDFTDSWPLGNMSATTASAAAGGVLGQPAASGARWRVVGMDTAGNLTTGVDSSSITTSSTNQSGNVSWSALAGAAGYRLFCYQTGGAINARTTAITGGVAGWVAVVDLPATVLSFYDYGNQYLSQLATSQHTPPSSNTTGSFGSRIIKHTSAGAWEQLAQSGGGFNGIVRSLAFAGHSGTLIAGGDFTTADGATVTRVAYTRGRRWLPLGVSGMNDTVWRVGWQDGTAWAAGKFTSADGNTAAACLARLDGFPTGGWVAMDVALTNAGSNQVYDFVLDDYDLFVVDDTSFSSAAGLTSVAYTGTAPYYPRLLALGPGLLRYVENTLTGDRLYINHTVQAGEQVIIDLAAKTVTSTFYGDIGYKVHPSSQLESWCLLPNATQVVATHMTGTTAASKVYIQGRRVYATGDA